MPRSGLSPRNWPLSSGAQGDPLSPSKPKSASLVEGIVPSSPTFRLLPPLGPPLPPLPRKPRLSPPTAKGSSKGCGVAPRRPKRASTSVLMLSHKDSGGEPPRNLRSPGSPKAPSKSKKSSMHWSLVPIPSRTPSDAAFPASLLNDLLRGSMSAVLFSKLPSTGSAGLFIARLVEFVTLTSICVVLVPEVLSFERPLLVGFWIRALPMGHTRLRPTQDS